MRTIIFLLLVIALVWSGNDNNVLGNGNNDNNGNGMDNGNNGNGNGYGNGNNNNNGNGNSNGNGNNNNNGNGYPSGNNNNNGNGNSNGNGNNNGNGYPTGNNNNSNSNGNGNNNNGNGNGYPSGNGNGNNNNGNGNGNNNNGNGNGYPSGNNNNSSCGNCNNNNNGNNNNNYNCLSTDQVAGNFFQQCFDEVYPIFGNQQNQNEAMSEWVRKWFTDATVFQIQGTVFNGLTGCDTFTTQWLSNYQNFRLRITEAIAVNTPTWDYHAFGMVCAKLTCGCQYLAKVHFSLKLDSNNKICNVLMDWNMNDCIQSCSNDGYDVTSTLQNWLSNIST